MKKEKIIRSIVVIALLLTLASVWGCSSDSDDPTGSSDSDDPTPTNLVGTVSEGPVRGATIEIFKIKDGLKGDFIIGATTNDDGKYSADVGLYSGPVLVESTGGTYIDEATGDEVTFTGIRRAAVPLTSGGTISVSVTPLTELAVRKAGSQLTEATIRAANASISQLLGPDGDILKDQPFDVTQEGDSADASDSEKAYSLLLAALSQMGQDGDKTADQIINELEEDLDDNKLDSLGADLTDAITDFVGNGNNHAGLGADDLDLDDIISDGLTPTGDLKDLKELLDALLADCTQAKLTAFIDYMEDFTPDSKEGNLYRAIAELAFIYNSDEAEFFKDLGIDIGEDIEANGEEIKNALLDLSADEHHDKIIATFAQLRTRLETVNTYLAKAEGAYITISLAGFDSVYLDDIDIKVIETMTNLMIAGCNYIEALDFTVEDWTVSNGMGGSVDFKDIDATEAQEQEFIQNNDKLLTIGNTSKLTSFRSALQAAVTAYGRACDALGALSEDGRRARSGNAFTLDDDYDYEMAKALNEHTVDSIIKAMASKTASIKAVDSNETIETVLADDDGFAYEKTTHTLFYTTLTRIAVDGYEYYTIYDLVQGNISPHSMIAMEADDGDSPELFEESGPTNIKTGVEEIDWDEPYPTYTVQTAAITIDGSATDWGSIPYYINQPELKVKLARSSVNNKMFAFVELTGDPSFLYFHIGTEWWYDGFSFSIQYGKFNNPRWSSDYYTNNNDGMNTISLIGSTGVEVELPTNSVDGLISSNMFNYFDYGIDNGELDKWDYGQFKLLKD